jgi:tetratricopeptide (TPR) repeat protein
MDASTLSSVLAAASLSEFEAPLSSRLAELNMLGSSGGDKKALQAFLKDIGCSKMGVRQRLAALLLSEIEKSSSHEARTTEASVKRTSGDIWGTFLQQSHALENEFDDLPPPVSAAADHALLSARKAPPAAVAVADAAARRAVIAISSGSSSSKQHSHKYDAAEAASSTAPSTTITDADTAAVAAANNAEADTASGLAVNAVMSSPRHINSALDQANLFRKLGDEALGRKDTSAAERWFSQALDATPHSIALLSRLAACALMSSPPNHVLALRRLDALFSLEPPHGGEPRLMAARSCIALGRINDAIHHYDALLSEEGVSEAAASQYTHAPVAGCPHLGGTKSLSETAHRAVDGRVGAHYVAQQVERSRRLAAEGSLLEALQAARHVRQSCNASIIGTELAIEAFEHHGELAGALDAANEGVARLPSDPSVRLFRARLRARSGKPAQAEEELAALVDLAVGVAGSEDAQSYSVTSATVTELPLVRAAAALQGLRRAMRLKEAGNAAYGTSQYERAVTCYGEALGADVEGCLTPTLLGNRSQAHMKLSQLAHALADCDAAIAIDRRSIRMLLRRAACRLELNQPDEAVRDYESVLDLDAENAHAIAGIEKAEEIASGTDGRKGGYIDFEGERLDPYEVLNVPKEANAVQIKAAFREGALKWHPDKHEGADEAAISYAVKQFGRVRIAYAVLSNPSERSRLDDEGMLSKGKGDEGRVKVRTGLFCAGLTSPSRLFARSHHEPSPLSISPVLLLGPCSPYFLA